MVIDPSRVIALTAQPATEGDGGTDGRTAEVREHRTSFDFQRSDFVQVPAGPRPEWGERQTKPSALRIVTLIAVLTVAVAIAVISAAPLAKSVQDLANMIEPPRRHS